ncbi:MAG: ester cyclase [Parvularculales bacterium]
MKGFDKKWTDFPDYILGITHEIWEGRNIASLHDYYTEDIPVRSPGSVIKGNKAVIAATMATLAEFPDRRLLGEDVIWSGTPEKGMLSSHRILSTATHLGDGVYGAASGKTVGYRVIGDCHAINNQINDEWLVRDQGAIVRQLGWDPKTYAASRIDREGGPKNCIKPFTPETDIKGPYMGRGNDDKWGAVYADILGRIMQADLTVIPDQYDRACQLELPGGVTGHGHDDADRFWMGLRASFPDAKFTIEHQIGREDKMKSPRAAIRWGLYGSHSGQGGSFGVPTGAMVYIMGICHAEFGPRGIHREFVVFDETAIWKQILMHTG